MKTQCTTSRKTISQSVQVVCRLGDTVMGPWVSIKMSEWWSWWSQKTRWLLLLIQFHNKSLCRLALTAFSI